MILKLSNMTFRVSNFKEVRAFWENVVGLPKMYEWPNFVVFDVGGGVRFSFEPGGKKGRKENASDIYFEVDDVDEAYVSLRDKGVRFLYEPKDQYWGGRTATFLDPDDNMFILVQLKK